jgi:hypothetical protein
MSLQSHLDSLHERHRNLDEQIAEISRRPKFDGDELRRLKVEKLRLKEEIERVRT